MRKSTCRRLGIALGAIGATALGIATPVWSAAQSTQGPAAHHYRHHVRHVVRKPQPPADAIEFGAAARIQPMRTHPGGTKN